MSKCCWPLPRCRSAGQLVTEEFFTLGKLVQLGLGTKNFDGNTTLLFLAMGMMGMGEGAVFQLLPQRFPERVGILTGLVGAARGLGGFFLPFILGTIKQRTGQYSGGLLFFAAAFFAAALVLLQLGTKWRAAGKKNRLHGLVSSRIEVLPELRSESPSSEARTGRRDRGPVGVVAMEKLAIVGNGMVSVAWAPTKPATPISGHNEPIRMTGYG